MDNETSTTTALATDTYLTKTNGRTNCESAGHLDIGEYSICFDKSDNYENCARSTTSAAMLKIAGNAETQHEKTPSSSKTVAMRENSGMLAISP